MSANPFDELSARVQLSRTRMLFTHVPLPVAAAALFGALLLALVTHSHAHGLDKRGALWLALLAVIAAMRTRHALQYGRSADQGADHWRQHFLYYTLAFSACWGASIWMLPVLGRLDMQAIVIGSVIGIAAAGAFMLTVDRLVARAWMAPIFGSLAIYCACLNSAYGWFGVVSIFGFMWLLWGEVGRSHRRVEELLRLRYESDRIASARAQALLEAEQLGQAKGRFLATMSHEMRTPLHGILGLSRLLRDELVSQEAHQRMNLLQGAGQHLLSVINDVLDFSRLQAGALELHLREVSLHELVQEVAALAQVNAQDKGVQVVLQSDLPPLFKVAVDVDRLKQVLHNLLGNAVKFTEQGQITVRLRREAGDSSTSALVFEVQDTGIGIPPEELGRVFDAFHQVDGSFERGHAGSGLGLSIAHEICVAMQGSLTCDSQMGVGSTFRCVLPLRTVGAPQEAAKPPATTGTSAARLPETTLPRPVLDSRSALQGTVLLVEDNPVNALVAQVELEQLGLQVALAENGCEALAWLAEHEADLVLMDCHMPEMNGFEATRRIRETESQRGSAAVPIIALTASARLEDHRHCLSAGMSDYLAKPFAHTDLLRVVRRHLIKGACRTVLPVAPPVIQSAEGVVV